MDLFKFKNSNKTNIHSSLILFVTFLVITISNIYLNKDYTIIYPNELGKYTCEEFGFSYLIKHVILNSLEPIYFVELNILDPSRFLLINTDEIRCIGKYLNIGSNSQLSLFFGFDSYLNNYFYIVIKLAFIFLLKNKTILIIYLNFLIEFLISFLLVININLELRILLFFILIFNLYFLMEGTQHLDVAKIKNNQKKITTAFLLIYLLIIFEKIYNYEYMVGYWLTNYRYGFIKRGFLGQFIHTIHELFEIPTLYLINGILCIIYTILVYYINYFFNLKQRNFGSYYLLLSPAFILFLIYDDSVLGRPEILGVVIYLYFLKNINKSKTYFLTSVFLSIAIFTHSINILIFPFLLYSLVNKFNYRKLIDYNVIFLFFIITLSFLSLIFLVENNSESTNYIINNLCSDAKNLNLRENICDGAISYLNNSFSSISETQYFWTNRNLRYYSSYIGLIILSILPFELKFWKNSNLLLLLAVLFSHLPIYYIAIDWGRFIWIYLFIVSIIYLNDYESKIETTSKFNFFGLLIYSIIWFLPVARGLRLDSIFTNFQTSLFVTIFFLSMIIIFQKNNTILRLLICQSKNVLTFFLEFPVRKNRH